jgi:hypothetical protein
MAARTIGGRCYRQHALTHCHFKGLHTLIPEQEHNIFEAAWGYAWYQEITFWRSLAGDHSESHPAAEHLKSTCLHGLSFYKTMAHQAQCRYGPVHTVAQASLSGAAAQRAEAEMKAAVEKLPPPIMADCSAFVQLCLMKMGDLARCEPWISISIVCSGR